MGRGIPIRHLNQYYTLTPVKNQGIIRRGTSHNLKSSAAICIVNEESLNHTSFSIAINNS